MRAVKEETLNELEDTVGPALKAVRAYLSYQGDNPQYRDKAKIAIGAIGSFAKVRASETNRLQVELVADRMYGAEEPKRLRAAK